MSRAKNIPASIRQRLLNLAKSRGEEFERLLVRFGLERLLYRLSQSPHAEEFVLKGAMLFTAWEGTPHRMTRDLDLLGQGEASQQRLRRVFQEVCQVNVPEDGFEFRADTVSTEEIRGAQEYGGVRITLQVDLAGAVFRLHVDVGFGDTITPAPVPLSFPTLLELPQPTLKAYTAESVIAEKTEAIVHLDMFNTRMKDYFDLWHLGQHHRFESETLRSAIRQTFNRRSTVIPSDIPNGLSEQFAQDASKQRQWQAFYQRIGDPTGPLALPSVIAQARAFLAPVLHADADEVERPAVWVAGGPWKEQPIK